MSDPGDPPAPPELERLASSAARADARESVREVLLAATPDAGIIAEGDGTSGPGARLQWVIDPLDGTVNFAHGVPLFAVSVAAALDGEFVAGAVLDVPHDELFSAHRGGGARRDGRPISVSGCESLSQALVTTEFSHRADLREAQGEVAQRLLSRSRDLRCFGSAAIESCWVACGRVDAYFQRDTEIWDRAAGALIAAEAGAATEMPCPENDDLAMAAAPGVFEALRAVVQPVVA